PCVQVFPFGRTFWMARTTNLASRGTLGCVGISTLTKSCPEGQSFRPSFSDKVCPMGFMGDNSRPEWVLLLKVLQRVLEA
ncbi:MAG: hypothetical protein VKJ27_06030, partial [Synechocystis sp.]|nr:hypothetical protein [Synechocystis sp.]